MIAPDTFFHQLPHEHAHLVSQHHPLFSRHGAQNLQLAGLRFGSCVGDRHGEMLARESTAQARPARFQRGPCGCGDDDPIDSHPRPRYAGVKCWLSAPRRRAFRKVLPPEIVLCVPKPAGPSCLREVRHVQDFPLWSSVVKDESFEPKRTQRITKKPRNKRAPAAGGGATSLNEEEH